jgi:hypothetical protein
MPRRSSKEHVFASVARRVVAHAIGETMLGDPLPDPNEGTILPPLRSESRGAKGGQARAAKLSPAKRKAIDKKAARARWSTSESGS